MIYFLCLVLQYMSTKYLTILLDLLWFLSSMFCSFQHTVLYIFVRCIPVSVFELMTVFTFFVSTCSLLVYRNIFESCMLDLGPLILLNSLISCRRFYDLFGGFLVHSLGFSIETIMLSAKKESFLSFFPIWMPFISFSCLVELGRTSMLINSGESGYPCFVAC